jgi:ectoine hydroxylase-related dioxygenase (phytanoyl-CoA dioxygenase family)
LCLMVDNVYMGRGSQRLCTAWVPWSDVPVEEGGLVVLRGSNSLSGFARMRETYGAHDVDTGGVENSGHIGHDPEKLRAFDQRSQWMTSNYEAGDVVVLTMHTIHSSLHNVTPGTLRLSCDVRFQPCSEPFDPRWVNSPDGKPPGGHRHRQTTTDVKRISRSEALARWGLAAAL